MNFVQNFFNKSKKHCTLTLFSKDSNSTTLEECSNLSLEEQGIQKLECGSARKFYPHKFPIAGNGY